ncbi:MAG: cytochrome c, class [Bryobacterales bacterium]|jgi:cytochrome c|nr:cytochrome c, class [Bryobacterales bacterium]
MQYNWTNPRLRTTLTIITGVVCVTIAMVAWAQDPDRGREVFEKRCTGCHALDKVKVGPSLRGVYGRNAGKDPQFAYSDAVKNASVTWDESTLDRWLNDTESVIPDNDMSFRLNDATERANIIAYLKQLSGK